MAQTRQSSQFSPLMKQQLWSIFVLSSSFRDAFSASSNFHVVLAVA
jgi:hypothetical protein